MVTGQIFDSREFSVLHENSNLGHSEPFNKEMVDQR